MADEASSPYVFGIWYEGDQVRRATKWHDVDEVPFRTTTNVARSACGIADGVYVIRRKATLTTDDEGASRRGGIHRIRRYSRKGLRISRHSIVAFISLARRGSFPFAALDFGIFCWRE